MSNHPSPKDGTPPERFGALWAPTPGTDGRMVGKPEHVDQLKAGVVTMHSQLAGNKVWLLRPHPLANAWALWTTERESLVSGSSSLCHEP